jgi:serine/threonine protein kinase
MDEASGSQRAPVIGELFAHYRIVSKIGQGGMGVVYRAHDEVLQRDVALKVMREGSLVEKSSRENLLREARAASALSHPNICTIHEVGEVDGGLYMVMELVEGKTLSAMIESAPPGVSSILRYGVQLAGALAHAHGRNVHHRDLKSANIVVTPQGLVKILDFGLARRLPKLVPGETTVTGESLVDAAGISGTLLYMAPEVLRGEPADFRSDLWALGVVLYEAASGELPFTGRTAPEASSAILSEPPKPLPDRIPPGLWSVIQRCLAKEPAQRYQQAGEVHAALEAVQSGSITSQVKPSAQRGPVTTLHRGIRHLRVKDGDVLLMVGTTKGAFLLRSTPDRNRWDVAGPYFHGHAIYALNFDSRGGRHRIWAATNSFWGSYLRSSDDFGKVWTNPPEANIKFPADCGVSLKNIWQICLGNQNEPNVMYCGVEPAALFESRDDGETWSLVRGLFDHPHRPRWVPGNGGLCLHTILPDPQRNERMFVAISSAGVYLTGDGGRTWSARNQGIRVVFKPEKYPEFGQCVHKVAVHPARPERLFLQNHWGLYRSDDGAGSWKDIAHEVPSDFGFAIVMHPHNPDCVYVLPVESDEFRCTPEGRLRVYRTRNAGASWEPLMRGLPQKGAYETVLRDAMSADSLHPHGLYFGTRTGKLYGSADEGKSWKKILDGLPSIVCVKSAVVGEPPSAHKPKPARAKMVPSRRPKIAAGKGRKRGGRNK